MKSTLSFLAAALLLLAAASPAQAWMDTSPNEVPGAPIRIVAADTLPDGLADFLRDYVQKNAKVGVDLVVAPVDAEKPLDEAARAAALTADSSDGAEKAVATIVVAKSADERRVSARPDEAFAVLNTSRLGGDSLALDLLEGRAGQEVLRELAILLGVEPCPFPLCVLTGYSDPAELDEMSDNYCPPCFERIRHAMLERGGHILAIPD